MILLHTPMAQVYVFLLLRTKGVREEWWGLGLGSRASGIWSTLRGI